MSESKTPDPLIFSRGAARTARPAQSDFDGLRNVRIRPRVRRLRRSGATGWNLHEGALARAPRRQSAASDLRDPGRHAERDRPPERGSRCVSEGEASEAARAGRHRHRERLGRSRGGLRRGGRGARSRGRARRDRAEHLVSQRRAGRDALRQLAAGDRVSRRPGARGDAASPDRQALAQRPRSRAFRPCGTGRGGRRALPREHVRGDGHRSGDRPAEALLRNRGALGPGDPAAGRSDGVPGRARPSRHTARRNRRDLRSLRRARVSRGRRDGGSGRDGELSRSGRFAAARRRARLRTVRRVGSPLPLSSAGRTLRRRAGSMRGRRADAFRSRTSVHRARLPDACRSAGRGAAVRRPGRLAEGRPRSLRRRGAVPRLGGRGGGVPCLSRSEAARHPQHRRPRRGRRGSKRRRDVERPRFGRTGDARRRAGGGRARDAAPAADRRDASDLARFPGPGRSPDRGYARVDRAASGSARARLRPRRRRLFHDGSCGHSVGVRARLSDDRSRHSPFRRRSGRPEEDRDPGAGLARGRRRPRRRPADHRAHPTPMRRSRTSCPK